MRYAVLGECSHALRRARRVQSCVTACSASAVMRYGVFGECSCALRGARRVLSCVRRGRACNYVYLNGLCPRMYFTTGTTTAKNMACIQSRVETAEVESCCR